MGSPLGTDLGNVDIGTATVDPDTGLSIIDLSPSSDIGAPSLSPGSSGDSTSPVSVFFSNLGSILTGGANLALAVEGKAPVPGVNPLTGKPYAINPVTGQPYPVNPVTGQPIVTGSGTVLGFSYSTLIVVAVLVIGGYFVLKLIK